VSVITAIGPWKSNAEMIRDAVVPLGYLSDDSVTLDATYKHGRCWSLWRPADLTTNDLDPAYGEHHYDFRALPSWWHGQFDVVTYDPPYKLAGSPRLQLDADFGVDRYMPYAERHALMVDGLIGCAAALRPKGILLAKCADQISCGKLHTQSVTLINAGREAGLDLIDVLHLVGTRTQPRPQQVHARRNHSTMLVFQRQGRRTRPISVQESALSPGQMSLFDG